jgi:hypothetical protein
LVTFKGKLQHNGQNGQPMVYYPPERYVIFP